MLSAIRTLISLLLGHGSPGLSFKSPMSPVDGLLFNKSKKLVYEEFKFVGHCISSVES